jgi:hypothetical protein
MTAAAAHLFTSSPRPIAVGTGGKMHAGFFVGNRRSRWQIVIQSGEFGRIAIEHQMRDVAIGRVSSDIWDG